MNPSSANSGSQANPSAMSPVSPATVADMFLGKYYDVLEKLPKYLSRFYKDESSFTVTITERPGEAARTETAQGSMEAIQAKVMDTVQGASAKPVQVDAQFSMGGGVLLLVAGNFKYKGLDLKFTQTFFLATQEKGYYVLNDILHIYPAVGEAPKDQVPKENGSHTPVAHAAAPVQQAPAAASPRAPAPQPMHTAQASASAPAVAPAPPPTAPSPAAPAPAAVETPMPPTPPAPTTSTATVAPHPAPAAIAPPAKPAVPGPAAQAPAQQAPREAPAAAAPAQAPQQAQSTPVQANLTYAQRLKQSMQAAAAAAAAPANHASPTPAASHTPAAQPPKPADAVEAQAGPVALADDADQEPAVRSSSGPSGGNVNGVYVNGLPQAEENLVDLLDVEFSKFGAIKAGKAGINVVVSPRHGKVAYITYEDPASMDAAISASNAAGVFVSGKRLKVQKMHPEFANGPQGSGGRGGRGGPPKSSSFKTSRGVYGGDGGRGGRGGRGGDRRPGSTGGAPGLGRGRGRDGERGGRLGGKGRGDGPAVPAAPKPAS